MLICLDRVLQHDLIRSMLKCSLNAYNLGIFLFSYCFLLLKKIIVVLYLAVGKVSDMTLKEIEWSGCSGNRIITQFDGENLNGILLVKSLCPLQGTFDIF